ncbi:hypothetical protein Q5752_002795 [Cryptotrichosporon argae]
MLRSLRALVSSAPDPEASGYLPVSADGALDAREARPLVAAAAPAGRGVYYAFWALGAGVLLGWNVLICTFPLLASFFPDSSTRTNLASYLSTIYCFNNLLFLGVAQRDAGRVPPSSRLRWSLLLLLGSALLLVPLVPLLPLLALGARFPLLLVATLALSLSCSYLQSAVFALSALWGADQTLAVMSGQGGIAVLVSLAQLAMALLTAARASGSGSGDEAPSSAVGAGLWALGAAGAAGCLYAHRYLVARPEYAHVVAPLAQRRVRDNASKGESWSIARRNGAYELAVAWVFVVTLSVFPPITTLITSVHTPAPRLLQPDVFIPLHFLFFNVGDYLGRTYLPGPALAAGMRKPTVLACSAARTVFPLLFLMCHISTRPGVPLINSDLLYFAIVLAFGASNGFVGSMCMIHASSPALNPAISDDEKDLAGTLAAFALVSGLALGSLCSFGVNYAVSGNPFG